MQLHGFLFIFNSYFSSKSLHMKNLYLIIALLLLTAAVVRAQNDNTETLIKEGITLHDKGEYKAALKKYNEVLAMDKNNGEAMYEASITYMSLKNYEKSIEYCDRLIATGENATLAYINKGTALDLMGDYDKSVAVYKEGIEKYPDEFLLHFNLGITYMKGNEIKKAEMKMYDALQNNPEHSSSNLILAYTQVYQQSKVRAILAFYYFLMLESGSPRARKAFIALNEMMGAGVTKEGSNKININIAADRDTTDPFYMADFYLSILSASMHSGDYAKMSESEKFYEYTKGFIDFIGDKVNTEAEHNFYINFYVRFLRDVEKEGLLKAYCYAISATSIKESENWVEKNKSEVIKLYDWFERYTSNNSLRDTKPIQMDPDQKIKKKR